MNKQENTKKTPIFGTYQKNGETGCLHNHAESYLIISTLFNKMIKTQNTLERHTNLLLMPLVGKSFEKNSKTRLCIAMYNHEGA